MTTRSTMGPLTDPFERHVPEARGAIRILRTGLVRPAAFEPGASDSFDQRRGSEQHRRRRAWSGGVDRDAVVPPALRHVDREEDVLHHDPLVARLLQRAVQADDEGKLTEPVCGADEDVERT